MIFSVTQLFNDGEMDWIPRGNPNNAMSSPNATGNATLKATKHKKHQDVLSLYYAGVCIYYWYNNNEKKKHNKTNQALYEKVVCLLGCRRTRWLLLSPKSLYTDYELFISPSIFWFRIRCTYPISKPLGMNVVTRVIRATCLGYVPAFFRAYKSGTRLLLLLL